MEIVLIGGERIVVGADVDGAALARVVGALSQIAVEGGSSTMIAETG